MKNFNTEKAINGSYFEAWIDGTFLDELSEFKADIAEVTIEVKQCSGHLSDGEKNGGYTISGSFKITKASSTLTNLIIDNLKAGQGTIIDIITNTGDTAAYGQERKLYKDCRLKGITLDNATSGAIFEQEISFTAQDVEVLDSIDEME